MPHRPVQRANRRFAKAMRQEMTPAELRLWLHLRKPGVTRLRFRRQAPIGPYIVDFLCPVQRLVVEVDGEQHGLPNGERRDAERDAWLRVHGYCVLRVTNRDVMTNLDGVCEAIIATALGAGRRDLADAVTSLV